MSWCSRIDSMHQSMKRRPGRYTHELCYRVNVMYAAARILLVQRDRLCHDAPATGPSYELPRLPSYRFPYSTTKLVFRMTEVPFFTIVPSKNCKGGHIRTLLARFLFPSWASPRTPPAAMHRHSSSVYSPFSERSCFTRRRYEPCARIGHCGSRDCFRFR